ncbi:MAG TPA: SdrD B-like domain-containing protein, partial [Tepidisphaeraceae bacterium]|nr:SdrD B-like domain-containing protein [Tepidisphaeraceae bacterium]
MAFPRARGRVRLQFLNAISHGIEQLERRTLMAAGALDTSFAGSGKDSLAAPPSTTINVGLDPTPVGLAIGPDGKAIISANGLDPSGGKFVELIRLLPNGSRDVTFGSAGAVTLFNTTVTKVAILNDGRILIGGSILARLNNNGAFDSTFGGLGFGFRGVSTPVVTGMALQSDGHILLAGQSGQSAAVWRYNPDGTTDGSYGAGGVRPLVFVEEDNSLIATAAGGIALDPQGRVVAGVSVTGPGTDTGYGVARINTNGSIDTKFGTGGLTQIDDAAPAAPAVAVASTGTIYLAATQGIASATSHGLLMVMSADGKKFAVRTTGLVPTTSAALDVQVQADNKPIVVGWERDGGGNGNKKIIAQRFQAGSPTLPVAAALDRTFNSTGSIEVDYNAGGSSEKTFGFGDLGWSLRLSPNQKIFIAGTSVGASGSQFTVTRLLPDSATLNSFGTISGTTFFDPNGNGVLESPDVPISGIETFLDLNGNGTFDGGDVRAFGNIAGAYQFIGLKAGTYQVRQHAGGNIKTTIPDNGLRTVTLASGGSVGNVNFAISVAGSISGFIFEDLNGDGLGEINEPVLPGFDCYLDLNNNGVYDAASEPRTIAGADGIYAFGGLNAGTYVVRQATPAGWTLTGPPAQAWTITLAQNEHRNNVNFADRAIAPGAHLDADGTLVVVGSAADDNIVVNQQVALGAAAGTVFVTVDANQQQFTTPAVKRIYIDGRDGNDVITDSGTDFTAGADGGIGILSTLIGGNGNDTLRVTLNDTQSNRSASDFVDGGAGDDTLFNDSNGNITMHGGDGNDT